MTSTTNSENWYIFYGDGEEHGVNINEIKPPPPWRRFREIHDSAEREEIEQRWQAVQALADSEENKQGKEKGRKFRLPSPDSKPEDEQLRVNIADAVNAALYLRRPLLVTGNPGSGKTSLAYAIAHELKLGPVLTWLINTRSTLQDGLYRYDAIARLHTSQLPDSEEKCQAEDIGRYITLGPVGTAFLPSQSPRVLLIDEIDKSDINLPNELLHLFEEGKYEITELVRWFDQSSTQAENSTPKPVQVRTEDAGIKASIQRGRVHCSKFPIIIMTSNAERDFPPAFLRRCLRVRMPDPDQAALKTIIDAHFQDETDEANGKDVKKITEELIEAFLVKDEQERATDQLLNAIYIRNNLSPEEFTEDLQELLLSSLSAID